MSDGNVARRRSMAGSLEYIANKLAKEDVPREVVAIVLRSYAQELRKAQDAVPGRDPVVITVQTRSPGKWRFVDMETRQVWAWGDETDRFRLATDECYPAKWGVWVAGDITLG